ncbi:hypothetical protein [Halobacterium sp. CBA1126]|uniref:hypothetical protein n=1 Tax=Halobacterium sp. CBA1126 TaxID=2668074 RepID=UPI0012FA30D1|nr:hypothetical protein [Halobacterium sp. CBA1126]MUV59806.1 hypothetical protein [Halobacterium sp. CBA1126]
MSERDGRGDHHLDEREPLAFVYDGETLLAVLYDRRMVASVTGNEDAVGNAFGVGSVEVSLTPRGEEVIARA